MSSLRNLYQFEASAFNPIFLEGSALSKNFVIAERMATNVYDGAISIKKPGELSAENEAIVRQIKAMRLLEDNWDEEGAQSIPPRVIESAIRWVHRADALDVTIYLASPGPNQEILLMVKEDDREIEIILYPDREIYLKFEGCTFVEQSDMKAVAFSDLLKWVAL